MSFACHINLVSTHISRFTGIFHHLRKIVPLSVLKTLYHSFIVPHIVLHIEIWGAAPETYMNKISIKQNKLLRAILGIQVIDGRPVGRVVDMYRNFNVLTVKNIFQLQLFKFLMYVLNENPQFYNFLLRPLETTHAYRTRGGDYRQPMLTCEVQRRGVINQLVLKLSEANITELTTLQPRAAIKRYKRSLLHYQ